MGITDKVTGGLQTAMRRGEQNTMKYARALQEQNDEIIDKLNWMLTTQQKICDHLKIKLADPLEMEEKKK
jgi:hypothetical protein